MIGLPWRKQYNATEQITRFEKKKSDVPLDCGYGAHVLTGKEAACVILCSW